MHDVAIVGGGPAGMTAAVYCARKQLSTMMLTVNIGGQTLTSWDIENYLGFSYIKGSDLVDRFQEHLSHFAVDIVYEKAVSIKRDEGHFMITTIKGMRNEARSIILATGKMPRKLGVPGEEEFVGRGIAYCATCDAPLFKGQRVAVVGGGNSGLEAALQLIGLAKYVYVIEFGSMLKADEVLVNKVNDAPNAAIMANTQVLSIGGDMLVDTITVKDRESGTVTDIHVSGVFVEIGLLPNSAIAKDIVELNEYGEIKIDKMCTTSVPGIFAAGDVTDIPDKQIIIAAGEGAKAALSAYSYVMSQVNAELPV